MVGELVMDRFRLLERLGSGGMGTVYRGFDERLQRYVAVKEIEAIEKGRVLREAQAAARLNHPGIVTLYEFGTDGDRTLLVSELVAGSTLGELALSGGLSDRDVAEVGADVADALLHAHDCGVVHRDLKPQNVIVRDEDGAGIRAKLMDFGIASLADSPTLTATGEVVGTLAYMAPEQADGRRAGPESDVYSLALTLYECWAGENPVRGETPAVTADRIGGILPSLRDCRPDLPRGITDVIDACLDPDPAVRPEIHGLSGALERHLDRLDEDHRVPAPSRSAGRRRQRRDYGLLPQVGALVLVVATLTLLGLSGSPGLALVAGTVAIPALLVASTPLRGLLPACAPILGLAAAGAAFPALAGALEPRAVARFVLGVAGWCALVLVAIALDAAPDLGAGPVPDAWRAETAIAADTLLMPLVEPDALLGAGAFGLGALAFGWILRAPHVALALLGALVWSAGLTAVLRVVGDGLLGEQPAIVAIAAAVAVSIAFRPRRERAARLPLATAPRAERGADPTPVAPAARRAA